MKRCVFALFSITLFSGCTSSLEISNVTITSTSEASISGQEVSYGGGNPDREKTLVEKGEYYTIKFTASEELLALRREKKLAYLSADYGVCGMEETYFFGSAIYLQKDGLYASIVPKLAANLDRRDGYSRVSGWPIEELEQEETCFQLVGGNMISSFSSNVVRLGIVGDLHLERPVNIERSVRPNREDGRFLRSLKTSTK